jgi:NAD(P)-dependent dehydrogenase (short-subunit alcohol dehydrogenase family)
VGGGETVGLANGRGLAVTFVPTDATDGQGIRRLVDGAVAVHGHVDCVFNNVGQNLVKALLDVTDDEWDLTLNTNLKSVFLGCCAAILHTAQYGQHVIINNALNARIIGRPGDPV